MTDTSGSRPRGRDAPVESTRRLLAHGGWTPAAELVAALADGIPGAGAERAAARLARAGKCKATDPAGREAIGRKRVAQERLNHLVHRGVLEATGAGDDRRYRLRGANTVLAKRPKPKLEWLPLDRLAFDPRLQMRDLPDGVDYDEATAARYAEAMEDGEEFPPLEVVHEVQGKRETYWVFAGFNRGEAYRRRGQGSVPVLVYPGTFKDAEFYALSENSKQPLQRTPADCWRAFERLLSSPSHMQRVYEAAKDDGGLQRALARAAGIGKSVVGKYLERAGLQADRQTGKLVPVAAPKPPPPPPPPPVEPEDDGEDEEPGAAREADGGDGPPPARASVSAAGDGNLSLAKDTLAKVQSALRAVGRDVEYLLLSRAADHLKAAARGKGLAFAEKDKDKHVLGAPGGGDVVVRVTYWPVLADLQAVFADVAARLYSGVE